MSEKKIARRKSKSNKKKIDVNQNNKNVNTEAESVEDIPERIIKLLKDE